MGLVVNTIRLIAAEGLHALSHSIEAAAKRMEGIEPKPERETLGEVLTEEPGDFLGTARELVADEASPPPAAPEVKQPLAGSIEARLGGRVPLNFLGDTPRLDSTLLRRRG